MKCENCEQEHDGSYGSGRFCSSKCARGFSTKSKRQEINEKVSNKLKGRSSWNTNDMLSICSKCQKEFHPKRKKQVYCSIECARKVNGCSESARKKISNKVKERIKNGTFSGWKSRKGKEPSYAEKYFINLFNNEQINSYERDLLIDKYFIDFAFIDKKIALEIDGKQHNYKDRIEKDIKKDIILKENGWNVIRIKWYNPTNDVNKEKLYSQIDNFKKIYKEKPTC